MKIDRNDKNILNVYVHGSKVYGTATPESDTDYIVVVKDIGNLPEQIISEKEDYTFYSTEQWAKMAENNDVDYVECHFLPQEYKLKEMYTPPFELDPEKIRRNFSKTASNSWVKCKKKFEVEKDYNPYVGKKSLFHSLRLLQFGISLITTSNIDYQVANPMYNDIMSASNWEELKNTYQPLRNQLKTAFKLSHNLHELGAENLEKENTL